MIIAISHNAVQLVAACHHFNGGKGEFQLFNTFFGRDFF